MSGDAKTSDNLELATVLEQLPEGIVIIDDQCVVHFANKVGARLVKLKPKTAVGSTFSHPVEDGTMRDFDVEMTVKEITWSGRPARLLHLKSLKNSGAFHLEWKLEAALERARDAEEALAKIQQEGPRSEASPEAPSDKDLSDLEDRITELENLLELAEKRADDMEGAIALDDHEQATALQDALNQARDAEEQVRQLEEELEESRERIRVAEEQAEVAEERAYSVELELEQVMSEQDGGQLVEQELRSEIEDLQTMVSTWRESVDRLTVEADAQETRLTELQSDLEAAHERTRELEKELELVRSQQQTMNSAQLEATVLEGQIASLTEESASLRAELDRAHDELARLQSELEASLGSTAVLEEAREAAEGQLSSLQEQLNAAGQKSEELAERCEALEQRLADKGAAEDGASARLSELEAQLENKQQETERLSLELAELREQKELAAEESEELAEQLRVEMEQYEERSAQVEEELETLRSEREQLKADNESLLEQLQLSQDSTEAGAELQAELAQKLSELDLSKTELEGLRKDVRRLEAQLESAEELAQKGEKVEKLERKLEGALRRAEEAEERLLEERRLLQELKGRIGSLEQGAAAAATEESGTTTFQDALTGLPNALMLRRYLTFMLKQSARHNRLTALLLIDCDNFATLVQAHGREAGDLLIRAIGERLSSIIRGTDVLGRLGDDEFAIVLSELSDQDEASVMTGTVLKRLYQKMRQPFMVGNQSVMVGLSVGISLFPVDTRNGEDMIKHAYAAVKSAKATQRGSSRYYSPELQDRHQARQILDAQLQRGLEHSEFQLLFQPIYDLTSGQVIGVESLIRWNHPEHGVLTPDAFLQVAEDSGMIVLIGNWVLRRTFEHAAEWQKHGLGIFVSINLSRRQLQQQDLVPTIDALLSETGCAADRVLLEIPERLTGPGEPKIMATLHELSRIGVRLAIDNFGTDSSSMPELRRGPFQVIKVDRKFIRGLPSSDENAGVVLSALTVSHHLQRISIAVGVESESERQWLVKTGCRFAQGNGLSEPIAPAMVPEIMKARHG